MLQSRPPSKVMRWANIDISRLHHAVEVISTTCDEQNGRIAYQGGQGSIGWKVWQFADMASVDGVAVGSKGSIWDLDMSRVNAELMVQNVWEMRMEAQVGKKTKKKDQTKLAVDKAATTKAPKTAKSKKTMAEYKAIIAAQNPSTPAKVTACVKSPAKTNSSSEPVPSKSTPLQPKPLARRSVDASAVPPAKRKKSEKVQRTAGMMGQVKVAKDENDAEDKKNLNIVPRCNDLLYHSAIL